MAEPGSDGTNYFLYSAETINAMVDEYRAKGIGKANMLAVHNDLKRLKPIIEKIYAKNIFCLSYFAVDAPFFGWTAENISPLLRITNGITQRFCEIYALILCGLGERLEEPDE